MKGERFSRMGALVVFGLALCVGWWPAGMPLASAAGAAPDKEKEYVAVYPRGTGNQRPFAIIEKPAGVPIGTASEVEIDAFALRVAPIGAPAVQALLPHLPVLDAAESQKLPPGFRVYADRGSVEVFYAAGSHKYKLTFVDPADVAGQRDKGGGNGGSM